MFEKFARYMAIASVAVFYTGVLVLLWGPEEYGLKVAGSGIAGMLACGILQIYVTRS
jgi:hypothetical protein